LSTKDISDDILASEKCHCVFEGKDKETSNTAPNRFNVFPSGDECQSGKSEKIQRVTVAKSEPKGPTEGLKSGESTP